MKTMSRIALTLAAAALIGTPARAQSTSAQSPSPQTAEQREAARVGAEAAKAALAAEQAAAAQAAAAAKQHLEQAQQQAGQAARHVTQVTEKQIQEALTLAERAREQALYERGTAALDQARYERALQAFAEAAALKGSRADGALYWKAFAEYKQAALQAAMESLREIQKDFPHSRWLEQARALEFEVRHASGEPVSPAATPDEEVKLLALNSLLHTDSEQALPALEKMISGPQPPRLKKRALFVLSQSKSPRAREILTSVAKSSSDPDLQFEAIQYLQMFGGAEDKKLLSDAYTLSKDRDAKLRLIDVLYVQGDAKGLVDVARKETDPAMRKRIVERLSTMKSKEATDFMLELINK